MMEQFTLFDRHDPRVNLALEEWLFSQTEGDFLRLWQNPNAVVAGKHQNALSECNFWFCRENGIPVIRRISGGGTVFHDLGNVNFSFFRKIEKEKMIDYDTGLNLIHQALRIMGFPVEMNERHDLYIGDKKVSGNAQHVRRGRSLHHGTVLYDANLDLLRKSIKRTHGVFEDKSVRSVRSPIANLREYKDVGDTNAFLILLSKTLEDLGIPKVSAPLVSEENVESLIAEKYGEDEWNFGYSPAYLFAFDHAGWKGQIQVARGGEITDTEIYLDGTRRDDIELRLKAEPHHLNRISQILDSIGLEESEANLFLKAFF